MDDSSVGNSEGSAHSERVRSYRDDPEAYEQACLREVLLILAEILAHDMRRTVPVSVFAVGLRHQFPETELWIDLARGESSWTLSWKLWGDEFGVVTDEANRASPAAVGDDIMIQVSEL